MKRLFLYAALLLLTQCSKCKDDPQPKPQPEPELPAITQTGANTFGCLLNGQVWRPSAQLLGPTLTAEYQPVPGQLLGIRASNYRQPVNQTMYFRLSGVAGPGRYLLLGRRPNYLEFNDTDLQCRHDTLNSVQAGMVDITRFDQTAKIVAGRFAFTLRRPGCPDVLVTDGRFDLRYR